MVIKNQANKERQQRLYAENRYEITKIIGPKCNWGDCPVCDDDESIKLHIVPVNPDVSQVDIHKYLTKIDPFADVWFKTELMRAQLLCEKHYQMWKVKWGIKKLSKLYP